jgi:hypothetical protein
MSYLWAVVSLTITEDICLSLLLLLCCYAVTSKLMSSYLGGTDRTAEGNWTWLDGTPWDNTSTSWGNGEPNGEQRENCLVLATDKSQQKHWWNDVSCENRKKNDSYICSYFNGRWGGGEGCVGLMGSRHSQRL